MYVIYIPQPYTLDATESYALDLNLNFSVLTC